MACWFCGKVVQKKGYRTASACTGHAARSREPNGIADAEAQKITLLGDE